MFIISANFAVAKIDVEGFEVRFNYSDMAPRRLVLHLQSSGGRYASGAELLLYNNNIEKFITRARLLQVNHRMYFSKGRVAKNKMA